MSSGLAHSIFNEVLFPKESSELGADETLSLRRAVCFGIDPQADISGIPLVVFDFETTGLDANRDRVIEIGAQKTINGEVLGEMSTLIYTDVEIPAVVQNLTGISPDMLVGKPTMIDLLPEFLDFIKGAILVAHNADFDMSFLRAECSRQGIDLDWPAFCTLKMARELLPDLERKNLDTLAEHFNLTFESRHRSIGDVKVTTAVLNNMLGHEGEYLETWQDLKPFYS